MIAGPPGRFFPKFSPPKGEGGHQLKAVVGGAGDIEQAPGRMNGDGH